MGNTVTNRVNVEEITKEVDNSPVMMYTRENCQFCTKAKQLLFEENIKYKECNLDLLKRESKGADYSGIVNGLVYKTSVTSVPQIFICGKFVGGFVDLEKLKHSRKLLELLSECTGENSKYEE